MVQKCPVCEGRGTMPRSFYKDTPAKKEESGRVECKSCNGTGIVRDIVYPSMPFAPYPPYQEPVIPWQPWPTITGPQSPHGGYCACKRCVPPIRCTATDLRADAA